MDYGGLRRGEIQIWPFVGLGICARFGVITAVFAEDISRLECEAELLGEYFPTFRKIIFRFELSIFTFIYISGVSKSIEFCYQLHVCQFFLKKDCAHS